MALTYHARQTYPNNAAAILNIRQFMRLQGLYLAVVSLGSYLITLDTVGYALRAFSFPEFTRFFSKGEFLENRGREKYDLQNCYVLFQDRVSKLKTFC